MGCARQLRAWGGRDGGGRMSIRAIDFFSFLSSARPFLQTEGIVYPEFCLVVRVSCRARGGREGSGGSEAEEGAL